jgi:hypothetical protein
MKRAWGAAAIVIGVWESAAAAGRLPTVTATIARCHLKRRRTTRALVGLMLIGLGRHLLAAA